MSARSNGGASTRLFAGNLDIDRERLDAQKGNGVYMGRHASTSPRTLPIQRQGRGENDHSAAATV
jgi:hypothetical protein